MVTKEQEKQSAESDKQEKQERQERQTKIIALISKNVTRTLGQPSNLIRVQVRPLWADYFRVNVLVGPDVASLKVAHSYFLLADAEGNILSANPMITKQY